MEVKDTILAGCEIICIGEQPTDLIACPLSDEEQEKCRSRRQYESGRQARIKEVMEWIESRRLVNYFGKQEHSLQSYILVRVILIASGHSTVYAPSWFQEGRIMMDESILAELEGGE